MRARLAVLALLAGCGGIGEPSAMARAQALRVWQERCVNCHGVQGEGDGPGAALLLPPPRRLSDPHWQGRVTDDHIAQVIVEGGLSAGLSPNMAANPDLRGHPELVRALVQMIREL